MMAVNEQSIPGGVSMKRNGVAAVIACLTLIGLITPAPAQAPAPAPQAKGVKSSTLVTSLGGFKETVSIPVVLSGQTVEIEPGGQTGRQRHLVPTFIYVLEGTLVTNSDGGRVGVAGAQYHAAGQSYSDPAGVWHNHSNPGPGPVKYLLLFLSTPGGDLTQKAGED
jgi:quercetin dioxygenase-like cupin family protein